MPNYTVVTNSYVTDYDFTESNESGNLELSMTGSGGPRLLLSAGGYNDMDPMEVIFKVESVTIPSGWWGFGVIAWDGDVDGYHNFIGPHERNNTTFYAHFFSYYWGCNTTSGWTSSYDNWSDQSPPFWVKVSIINSTMCLYESADGESWVLRKSYEVQHYSELSITHFGIGLHALSVSTGTISIELSNVSWPGIDSRNPPTVVTKYAGRTGLATASLVGELSDLGGHSSVDCYFQYRVSGAETWDDTYSTTDILVSTGYFEAELTGLSSETTYEFRVVGKYEDSGTQYVYGDTDTFSTELFGVEGIGFSGETSSTQVNYSGCILDNIGDTDSETVSEIGYYTYDYHIQYLTTTKAFALYEVEWDSGYATTATLSIRDSSDNVLVSGISGGGSAIRKHRFTLDTPIELSNATEYRFRFDVSPGIKHYYDVKAHSGSLWERIGTYAGGTWVDGGVLELTLKELSYDSSGYIQIPVTLSGIFQPQTITWEATTPAGTDVDVYAQVQNTAAVNAEAVGTGEGELAYTYSGGSRSSGSWAYHEQKIELLETCNLISVRWKTSISSGTISLVIKNEVGTTIASTSASSPGADQWMDFDFGEKWLSPGIYHFCFTHPSAAQVWYVNSLQSNSLWNSLGVTFGITNESYTFNFGLVISQNVTLDYYPVDTPTVYSDSVEIDFYQPFADKREIYLKETAGSGDAITADYTKASPDPGSWESQSSGTTLTVPDGGDNVDNKILWIKAALSTTDDNITPVLVSVLLAGESGSGEFSVSLASESDVSTGLSVDRYFSVSVDGETDISAILSIPSVWFSCSFVSETSASATMSINRSFVTSFLTESDVSAALSVIRMLSINMDSETEILVDLWVGNTRKETVEIESSLCLSIEKKSSLCLVKEIESSLATRVELESSLCLSVEKQSSLATQIELESRLF